MSVIQRPNRCRVREILTASLLITGVVCPSAEVSAASLLYFAGGRTYAIERSETEFAIELLGADTPAAADARFRTLGLGTVERLPWGPADGRFALLRVAQADAQTRARALADGLVKSVRHVYRFRPQGQPHIGTGRLVVKLAESASNDALATLLEEYGTRLVRPLGNTSRAYVLEPRVWQTEEVGLAARMHLDPRVEYAHPDLISPLFKTQIFSDEEDLDPYGLLQWHLHNTGQEGGVVGADINIEDAFEYDAFGAGVIVGMLDDACDVLHDDLVANYINVSHDASTGKVSQLAANPTSTSERHGTAMMGLICASLNKKGVVGVAPATRFTVSRGADDGLSASEIADAFDFALDRDVDIHCDSWAGETGTPSSNTVRNAIEEAFTEGRDGLGMVIVFPTGNTSEDLPADSTLAGLTDDDDKKLVIGVGACNALEEAASYSNYGIGVVDVLAPSGDEYLPQIVTTDNTDEASFDAPGYNNGGFDDFGQANLTDSSYTQGDSFSEPEDADFFGTSAACAQVAGVAALVLSTARNQGVELTATQVRAILEHTTNRIPLTDPKAGDYNVITGRSLVYGYGRVNAGDAVEAARLLTENSPFTWPERVKNVEVTESDTEGKKLLTWEKNDDLREVEVPDWESEEEEATKIETRGDETTSVLVVQRIGLDFEWVPDDDDPTYSEGQVEDYEQKVTVVQVGDDTSYEFDDSLGIIYFGVFARNAAGRYSFGVSINSEGDIFEVGRSTNTGAVDDNENENDNTSGGPAPTVPTVSIEVSSPSGVAPLLVSFRGNSPESDSPIISFSWDFGDGSDPVNESEAEYEYEVPGTYTATFTVTDADGDVGTKSIVITVLSSESADEDPSSGGAIRIIISDPDQAPADIGNFGVTGSRVELTVDTSRVVGSPQTIFWHLGDGTIARSFVVSHTYTMAGGFPITAEVTTQTTSGDHLVYVASRLFTVEEDSSNGNGNANDNTSSSSSGGSSTGTCGLGMLIPMFTMLGLVVLRRARFLSL